MTEAQIVVSIMALLFILIAYASKSTTYIALACVYAISAVSHWVFEQVPTWSVWWPALYSTLDIYALITIAACGDMRKKLNIWLLSALITMHGLLAWDLFHGTNMVFLVYYQVIMAIIAGQIIVGFWDAIAEYRRVNRPADHYNKHGHHVKNHHQGATS